MIGQFAGIGGRLVEGFDEHRVGEFAVDVGAFFWGYWGVGV